MASAFKNRRKARQGSTQSLASSSTNSKKTVEPQSEAEADLLTRILATGGDLLGNVVTGAVKGVEGIVDFGIGAVGAVGGLFDEDFRDGAQKAIEYDATHEWLGQHIDRWTEDSFTNDSEIVCLQNTKHVISNLFMYAEFFFEFLTNTDNFGDSAL